MANPTELVIFDCDGVLVDSEIITMRTIIASCADLGLELEMAEAEEMFTGGHWAVVLAEIERRLYRKRSRRTSARGSCRRSTRKSSPWRASSMSWRP